MFVVVVVTGRVHSAIVSGVNWQTRSVTVEWFEQGEAKGKELPVDQILTLNPDLYPDPLHFNASTGNNNQNNRLRLVSTSVRGVSWESGGDTLLWYNLP